MSWSKEATVGIVSGLICFCGIAEAERIEVASGSVPYKVWLRQSEIPLIQGPANIQDVDPRNEGEALSVFAQWSPLWNRIRDTQNKWIWFVGVIEPKTDTILWPPEQILGLFISEGEVTIIVNCVEVLASNGDAVPGPLSPQGHVTSIYPGGVHTYARNLRQRYPDGREAVIIYVAFPLGGWDGDDVRQGSLGTLVQDGSEEE